MNTAILIVDVQHDFLPGGALGVKAGNVALSNIPGLASYLQPDVIVATRDAHSPIHCSFTEQGGPWPPHCIDGTHGGDIHSDILALGALTAIKGDDDGVEEYSGWNARLDKDKTTVANLLAACDRVFVAGIATDYCVKATVLDALSDGANIFIVLPCIAGVGIAPTDKRDALAEMVEAGATLVDDSFDEVLLDEVVEALFL